MKKIQLMKTVLLLFAVFAFSNCEEDGPIQFQVKDDFENNVSVKGLEGQSEIIITEATDVSDILDNGSTFVIAKIESVTVFINNDYDSDSTIAGTYSLEIGNKKLIDELKLELSKGKPGLTIDIPKNSQGILSSINSGKVEFVFSGKTDSPILDNDFSLNVTFNMDATVE